MLRGVDEFALIERIHRRLARDDARVRIGIGDDAAVLAPMARGSVLSVDVGVEGVHFDRRWLTYEDVGWRGYVAALSDLAAMGAAPVAGLLSMVLPADLDEAAVLAVIDGVAAAADRYGAPVVGGNLSAGRQLALHSTVVGEAPEAPLRRRGARVGDGVFVTGTVGAAALGWKLLSRGRGEAPEARPFVARWRRPRARFDLVDRVSAVATACIDVSDGVLQDLGHVCAQSAVGADVEAARLPTEPGQRALAAQIDEDPDELALSGGEDFELLFTAPLDAVPADLAVRIGVITEGEAVRALDADGAERRVRRPGHRHFA
jgi:thiamine-monophosphate kinase